MKLPRRPLTFGEEVGNAVSHGIAAFLVLCALPWMAIAAYSHGTIVDVTGIAIYGLAIFLMFLCSTLYHTMQPDSLHKEVLHILDHVFIYVAIAGTYTPIAITVIGGWKAAVIVAVQWVAVLMGVFFKVFLRRAPAWVSLTIYLVMGWSAVMFFPLLLRKANPTLLWLIVVGGILYSIGAIVYALKNFKYFHLVWHIFVFLAALAHFIGICFFLWS
jgi:hemolysin III